MVYDSIIIGAGPGGLQAAVYLGRFNRKVLLLDRSGGRTRHARHIENFLSHPSISGSELIERGIVQATGFGITMEQAAVTLIEKKEHFIVTAGNNTHEARFVIVSSGVYDNLPDIENLHTFLGNYFFTCVYCDGYKTTGRKLVVIGNSIETVRLAFGMKDMYTPHITILLYFYQVPQDYRDALNDAAIDLLHGRPSRIIGNDVIESLELEDGRRIPCEVIMSNFGFKLNDAFLSGLALKRDARGFKYEISRTYESSLHGLYIVGPLNTGNDQAVIAAGEGAVAAIDINKRLLELRG